MSDLPEPLEDFLQHPPDLPAEAALQQSLARRTSAMLPRARHRRWPMTAAFAASVLLTLVSAYFVLRYINLDDPAKKDFVENKNEAPQEKPKSPKDEPKPAAVAKVIEPRELEWTAFDAANDAERARLYYQAGDLYVEKHADYDAAVRCYAQAIRYSEPRDLEFNPDDNWLVMALKRDHRKEK
jgi:hypothetical protein